MTTFRPGGWSDEHEDAADTPATNDEMIWERPRASHPAPFVPRLGIAGPDGKLSNACAVPLLEWLIAAGNKPLVIAHDPAGWEWPETLRRIFASDIDGARIVSITSGTPDAPTALLQAVAAELTTRFPEADIVCLIGSAGAAHVVLDPTLVHYTIGVLDGTAIPHPIPVAMMTVDCLIIHAPEDRTRRSDRDTIASLVTQRGHLLTSVVDLARVHALDDVFGIIWTDLFC